MLRAGLWRQPKINSVQSAQKFFLPRTSLHCLLVDPVALLAY